MQTNDDTVRPSKARLTLAALWISHFLLWTYGDMLALLQDFSQPVADSLLLSVAVPLALIQTLMILFSIVGKAKPTRWATIAIALVFLVFNAGFVAEAHVGWEYLLGAGYLLVNGLIAWYAWKWPVG